MSQSKFIIDRTRLVKLPGDILLFCLALTLTACFEGRDKPQVPEYVQIVEHKNAAIYFSEGKADGYVPILINQQSGRQGSVGYDKSYYQFPATARGSYAVLLTNAFSLPTFKIYADPAGESILCESTQSLFKGFLSARCQFQLEDPADTLYMVVDGEKTSAGSTYQISIDEFIDEGSAESPIVLTEYEKQNISVAKGESWYQFATVPGSSYQFKFESALAIVYQVTDSASGEVLCDTDMQVKPECRFTALSDQVLMRLSGQDLETGGRASVLPLTWFENETDVFLTLDNVHQGSVSAGGVSNYGIPLLPYRLYRVSVDKDVGSLSYQVVVGIGKERKSITCETETVDQLVCMLRGVKGAEVRVGGVGGIGGLFSVKVSAIETPLIEMGITDVLQNMTLGNQPIRYHVTADWGSYHTVNLSDVSALFDVYIFDDGGTPLCIGPVSVETGRQCSFYLMDAGYTIHLVSVMGTQVPVFSMSLVNRRVNTGTFASPVKLNHHVTTPLKYIYGVGAPAPVSESIFQLENASSEIDYTFISDFAISDVKMEVFDARDNVTPFCTSDNPGTLSEVCKLTSAAPPVYVRMSSIDPFGSMFSLFTVQDITSQGQSISPILYDTGTMNISHVAPSTTSVAKTSYYRFNASGIPLAGEFNVALKSISRPVSISVTYVTAQKNRVPVCNETFDATTNIGGCPVPSLNVDEFVDVAVTDESLAGSTFNIGLIEDVKGESISPPPVMLPHLKYVARAGDTPSYYALANIEPGVQYEMDISYSFDVKLLVFQGEENGAGYVELCKVSFSPADGGRHCIFSTANTDNIQVRIDQGASGISSKVGVLTKPYLPLF